MSYLLRVHLQDRPGSLGLLAMSLGSVGADILSLDVVERGDGYAIDDVVVEVPRTSLPDTLITASEKVDGVTVESIRPYTGVLETHRELELIDHVASAGKQRLQALVDNTPRVLRVSWSMIVTRSGGGVLQLFASPAAPETPLERADWLPLSAPTELDGSAEWVPQAWRDIDTRLAASPIGGREPGTAEKALLLGRPGGPDFLPAEIARLGYLTRIVSTLIA